MDEPKLAIKQYLKTSGMHSMHFRRPMYTLWEGFTRYVEVADDLRASRQVDVYDTGRVLRYDRKLWNDKYDELTWLRFKPDIWQHPEWITSEISRLRFETIWAAAADAPNQPQQYDP